MQGRDYPGQSALNRHAGLLALIALVVAVVGVGGAVAAGVVVTSKQIRNGTILSQDIKNNNLKSADIQNGSITAQDVTMPQPSELDSAATARFNPTMQFSQLDVVGTYTKETVESVLEIDWTGTVEGHNGGEVSGCVFQLRVDGQPSPEGGGEVFGEGVVSVSDSALFPGLPAGAHTIEVWARLAAQEPGMGGQLDQCAVGPASASIGQAFVVSEQVF